MARYGPGFEATLWRSRQSQRARFEIITSTTELAGRRILDAGCGFGCLAHFLRERTIGYAHYLGIDGVPEIIREAQSKTPPRAEFILGDYAADRTLLRTGDPDIIMFCGSLNTLEEALAWEIVEDAWDAARIGVVFNFLSDLCDPAIRNAETGPARRFNTADWIQWTYQTCRNFVVRHDYLEGQDVTIAMLRECPLPADAPRATEAGGASSPLGFPPGLSPHPTLA